MKQENLRRLTPAAVIAVMVVLAVVVAAVRGSTLSAVLAAVVGGLLLAYVVRHQMRARLIHGRDDTSPDDAHWDQELRG
jgi:hypothetical protein